MFPCKLRVCPLGAGPSAINPAASRFWSLSRISRLDFGQALGHRLSTRACPSPLPLRRPSACPAHPPIRPSAIPSTTLPRRVRPFRSIPAARACPSPLPHRYPSACPAHPPIRPSAIPSTTLPRRVRSLPLLPSSVCVLPCICVLRRSGRSPGSPSCVFVPLNSLSPCTPFVPSVPFVAFSRLTSPGSPLASCLLPLAFCGLLPSHLSRRPSCVFVPLNGLSPCTPFVPSVPFVAFSRLTSPGSPLASCLLPLAFCGLLPSHLSRLTESHVPRQSSIVRGSME